MSELFFSGHQPYVCRFLKVLPLTRKNFGRAIFLRKWAKCENFPGQRNLQKFPQKFQPATTGSFAWVVRFYQIIIHLDVPGVPSCVCRHWGPDSSSKNPRCWLMISSSLQGFRYQQLFQDLSWRYVVTQKMGMTTSIKYLFFWYLKGLD